jgi:hypothetical protein
VTRAVALFRSKKPDPPQLMWWTLVSIAGLLTFAISGLLIAVFGSPFGSLSLPFTFVMAAGLMGVCIYCGMSPLTFIIAIWERKYRVAFFAAIPSWALMCMANSHWLWGLAPVTVFPLFVVAMIGAITEVPYMWRLTQENGSGIKVLGCRAHRPVELT